MATNKRNTLCGAWSIANTYWVSEEKWPPWGLLQRATIIRPRRSPIFRVRLHRPPAPPTQVENAQSHYSILAVSRLALAIARRI